MARNRMGMMIKGLTAAALAGAFALGVPAVGAGESRLPHPIFIGGCRPIAGLLAYKHHLVGAGERVDRVLCHDFTHDGRRDIAFSIFSGGTAGDTQWGVFVARPGGGYRLASYHPDTYGIQIRRVADDLLVSTPVYVGSAPNCCPSYFHLDHWRYDPATGGFLRFSSHVRRHYPFGAAGWRRG